ncbi:hypothetical protein E3E14_28735 [Streptomyces sp. ICN441]|uniref:DUF4232 domain-containing protein n=1 Tax=Streptomyces tirandamycinicus TaxID=2174846 RepID=A0A2S1SUM2_9ACTN|nr:MULTISPECIES: hypothetical protein [Streptomyces]AWI30103.1 hypothetical protein DDW44_15985 [Streptomyces tirandamycinicus]TFE38200.1 hypothetical protein E3E14_28735 [Streptomyces sp. ICN441]
MTGHEHGPEHGRDELPREDLPRGDVSREVPARTGPAAEGRREDRAGTDRPRKGGVQQDPSGCTPDGEHTTGLYGPDGPLNDRTGKETVNDGPRNGMDDQGFRGDSPRDGVPSVPPTPPGDLPGRDRLLRDLLGGPAQDGSVQDGPAPDGREHGDRGGPEGEDRSRHAGKGAGKGREGHAGNGWEGHGAADGSGHRTATGAPGSTAPGSTAPAAVPGVPAPDGLGHVPGPDGLGHAELGHDGLAHDELALRRLLHDTVGDLEPTDGALEQLRRAVPARRARKRQALVGMAASVILLGTAVPAFVHVAGSGGLADNPVNAGHGEQAQGGTGEEELLDGGQASNGDPAGRQPSLPGAPRATQQSSSPGSAATAGEPGGTGTAPSDGGVASTPACEAGQLGVDAAQAGAPDADGTVYGTFRISNVSASECSIGAAGAVTFRTAGAADATKISVVTHTTGDAASGLPDPSEEVGALVLKPETSYEVKFAFVPSDTCPTNGASPDPTPTDGASGTTDGAGAASDSEPQLYDGTMADGSVSVVHTPDQGAPNAEATIPNACAGTIYRTGLLNPS